MNDKWGLVAVKRDWVPEWLWTLTGQLPKYQPFRWIMTRVPRPPAFLDSEWGGANEAPCWRCGKPYTRWCSDGSGMCDCAEAADAHR